jgi:putative copper resistance protein D
MLIALKLVFLSEKDEQMNHKWIFWVALVCLFTIPAAALGAVPKAQGSTHYFYLPFTPAVTQLFMLVSMDDQSPMNSSQMRMLMTDKAGSEFNHHLAGILIILAGLFILAEGAFSKRWSLLRFAWPFCFLISGLFLLGYSDKELWPFGPQSWWYGLTHSLEVLQHKAFALILLAIGIIEVQRARGAIKAGWSRWIFPVLACCGSVMLLFHEHSGEMIGAGHMGAMAQIQTQHRSFAAAGFGIGIFKGFSELPTRWQEMYARLWPSLVIVLGVLLLVYSE